LVYSALVWTVSSGGALQGASLMLAFGLGTLPNLLLMGVAANQLNRWTRRPLVRQLAGALVAGFGVWLLYDAWLR
jgi:sulfite exporter TauE/SafE